MRSGITLGWENAKRMNQRRRYAAICLYLWCLELVPHSEIPGCSEELRQCCRQIDEVNRLGDIVAEAGLDALVLDVGHDVGGECNDG